MSKNFYIENVNAIFTLAERENVDVGVGFEMFRAKHRSEQTTKLGKDAEADAAAECGDYISTHYTALCEQYNAGK